MQTGQQPVLFRILFCEVETNTVSRTKAAATLVRKSHREAPIKHAAHVLAGQT